MPRVGNPCVDLIVATYGHPELLKNCLRSLRTMDFQDYRLIVVDDASPVPVEQLVAVEHPGAMVLRAARNGGLVRALNRGIAHGSAPLVALLNDDTEVASGWLGSLVGAAERHTDAGSFASKMLLIGDPPRFHSAGDDFAVWGRPINRGVWLDDLGQYDREERIFGACAGAALYRRSALEAVTFPDGSAFDRRLYMYLEDVDLAWRLQRGGFDCVYVPSASVRHHLSASGGGKLASFYVSRNLWSILLRSMPRALLREYAVRILLHHFGRNLRHVRHIRSAEARASLRGTVAGLANAPLAWRQSCAHPDRRSEYPLVVAIDSPASQVSLRYGRT